MAGISLRDAEAARLQITREQAAEVQNMYRRVYKDYRAWLKSMTSGGATTSLRKTQLKKLTEELKTAYEGLGRQLEGNITFAVTQTSQAVVQANNSWMSGMGLKITGAYAHVPQDIVVLLASGKLYSDGWTLSKAIWGESQQKAHEIDLIVAKGVALNKSAFDIAKDLESYVNPGALKPWDWSKVYPGTSKKVDYNAQRLARTMVSHAYQQSLERVCNKNPFVIGYKWRSAHTARTCEICNQRSTEDHHGLGPGVYPKGELPLDHPNGMCTFLTVMSDDLEGISNRLADWANGKEDPALDKWYNSMRGLPLNREVTPVDKDMATGTEVPREAKYLDGLNGRSQEWLDKIHSQSGIKSFEDFADPRIYDRSEYLVDARMSWDWKISEQDVDKIITKKLQEIVKDGQVGVRVPQEALSQVLEDGLKNQFQTKTSKGALDFGLRSSVEQKSFGVPLDASAATRPIYGMMYPSDSKSLNSYAKGGPGKWYGDAIVFLKKDNIINNSTLTIGDSLDTQRSTMGTEMSHPQYTGASQIWAKGLTQKQFESASLQKLFKKEYLEVQIHGESGKLPENIEKILFTKEPDSGIITLLKEKGIQYDVVK